MLGFFLSALCVSAVFAANDTLSNDVCTIALFNAESVDYVNYMNKENEEMYKELRQDGIEFLKKRYEVIRGAFENGKCGDLMPAEFTKDYRDESLYEFLESFETLNGTKLSSQMLDVVKEAEEFIWYAAKNGPFTSCVMTKLRNVMIDIMTECMGEDFDLDVSNMKSYSLPDMMDEEFAANVRGLLNMFLKGVMQAEKCDNPKSVLVAMNKFHVDRFCKSARAAYGSVNKECFKSFEEQCPRAMECLRGIFTNWNDKTRAAMMGILKDIKDCTKEETPEGAPSAKQIMRKMLSVVSSVQKGIAQHSKDPEYARIKERTAEYMMVIMDAIFNESACECLHR